MPKQPNPSKRVPPEIKSFVSAYDPAIQALTLKASALVLEFAPDALEQLDLPAKMLTYGFAATYKDMICMIAPQKAWVNLGLPRGTTLPDPEKLLTGTGKKARHIKLTTPAQLDNPAVRALLHASIAQIKKP